MVTLTFVQGSDYNALYIDGEHKADAYHGELWDRDFVLDIIDEYTIDSVEKIYTPDMRDHSTVPDTLQELEESDKWSVDKDVTFTKRDSIKA
jgi:hypothetical protein